MTSPSSKKSDEIEIVVAEPGSKIMLAGTAKMHEGISEFSIRSVSQQGAFPVIIEGAFREDRLEVKKAQFSPIIQMQNQPTKSD